MNVPGGLFSLSMPYSTDYQFRWPVSLHERTETAKSVENSIIEVAPLDSSREIRDIFFIAYKYLLTEYVSLFDACLLLKRAEDYFDNLVFTHHYPMFLGLQEKGVPYSNGVSNYNASRKCSKPNLSPIRRWVRQVLYVGAKGLSPFSFDNTITMMSASPLILNEIKKVDNSVYYLIPYQLFNKDKQYVSTQLEQELQKIVKVFQEMFLDLLVMKGWDANNLIVNYIFDLTNLLFLQVANDYLHVEKLWRKRVPRILWSGSGGNYWERIARSIVKVYGGEVVGFDHGGPTSILHPKGLYYSLALFTDRFITFTEPAAILYRNHMKDWRFGLPKPKIEGCRPPHVEYLKKILDREKKQPVKKKIERLMYVATYFRGEKLYPQFIWPDDFVFLDWQARLMKALNDEGFKVLYKSHPEGLLKGSPLEFTRSCEFYKEWAPIESVWHEADAFIFDFIGTAFWHALCTQKRVIWINLGQHHIHRGAYKLLKRRCQIIETSSDDDNRFQVNLEELIDKLNEPLTKVDMSFVFRYLIGSNDL